MPTTSHSLQSSQGLLNGGRLQTSPQDHYSLQFPADPPVMFSPQSSLSRGSRESSSLSPSSRGQMHDPNSLPFPDVPSTELPPIQSHNDRLGPASNHTLPSLSSVTGGPPPPLPPIQRRQPEPIKHWPSLNPLTAFYAPSHVQTPEPPLRMDYRLNSTSPDRSYEQRAGSVSLDDPAVRAAAEALGELRADFLSSPPTRNTSLPAITPDRQTTDITPEPLLSLITTTVPSLASTVEKGTTLVENATSLYNQGKNMSPTVVKNGVEYVEGYITPVAKAVGNAGRRSGMETTLRWFLTHRRRQKASSDLEPGDRGHNKRRKTKLTQKEVEAIGGQPQFLDQDKDRRMSISTVDTLPAYDDLKSPAYIETLERDDQASPRPGSSSSAGLPQIVMVTTSKLGAAMTQQGLHNLKVCLARLRSVNTFIAQSLEDLKATTEKYDAAAASAQEGESQATAGDRYKLVEHMTRLRSEIYSSLAGCISDISRYAGSALPQNAREFVYSCLKSLPSRFPFQAHQHIAEEQKNHVDHAKATREAANLVLEFAKEGIETMNRVSDILERTITSAEEWIDTKVKTKEGDEAGCDSPRSIAESGYSSTIHTPAHFSAVGSPMSMSTVDITMSDAR